MSSSSSSLPSPRSGPRAPRRPPLLPPPRSHSTRGRRVPEVSRQSLPRVSTERFLEAARLFPQPSLPPLAGCPGPAPQWRSRQPLEGRDRPANQRLLLGPTSVSRCGGTGALLSSADSAPPVRSSLSPARFVLARPRGNSGRSQRISPGGGGRPRAGFLKT